MSPRHPGARPAHEHWHVIQVPFATSLSRRARAALLAVVGPPPAAVQPNAANERVAARHQRAATCHVARTLTPA